MPEGNLKTTRNAKENLNKLQNMLKCNRTNYNKCQKGNLKTTRNA